MARTRSRPTTARPPSRKTGATPRNKQTSVTLLTIAVIIAVGLLALVIAIVATKDSNTDADTEQTRPVTVGGAALPALPASGPDPAIGRAAPSLSGAAFDGTPVVIGGDARPKIIVFAAHWCPHCRAEVPVIEQWLEDEGRPDGVDLVAVSTAVNPAGPNYPPSAWLEGWPVTTLADSSDNDAARAYAVDAYPYFVVVRGDGKVALRVSGELSPQQLTALVDQARR
jgi:thiol-disulfide isomerase/thioredoxin